MHPDFDDFEPPDWAIDSPPPIEAGRTPENTSKGPPDADGRGATEATTMWSEAAARFRLRRTAGLCWRWLVVLLIQESSNERVRGLLADDDLPCPRDEQLDSMRADLSGASRTTPAQLDKLGVSGLLAKTLGSDVRMALVILRRPRVRELVESMLTFVHVPLAELSNLIRKTFSLDVGPTVLRLYRNAFYDVEAFTRPQLRVLVEARVRMALEHTIVAPEDEAAAQAALAFDPRMVALRMPVLPLAVDAVVMAAGYVPASRGLGPFLAMTMELVADRLREAMLGGDVRKGAAYLAMFEGMQKVRAAMVPADFDFAQGLAKFVLLHSDPSPVTIDELRARGDRISVDPHFPPVAPDNGEVHRDPDLPGSST